MRSFLITLALSVAISAQPVVVTAIPALESIGRELVVGTPVKIVNPVAGEYGIAELPEMIKARATSIDSVSMAVAVLSLRSIMEEDQLFTALRQKNIRIVEIDAATPLNQTLTAVGTISNEGVVNPLIWLAPSAVIRSAEIIAKDFEQLFPEYAETIENNLQKLRAEIRALQNEFEPKFIAVEQFEVATMDRGFDYLLKDINLFVTMEFPGEMNWSDEDLVRYSEALKNGAFSAVIHRWEPIGDPIDLAVKAGVKFVTPDAGFPSNGQFDKGIATFLKKNFQIILDGFAR